MLLLGSWARGKVKVMDEVWDVCNSLRYGFDDEYDPPVFDDIDETLPIPPEETEEYWGLEAAWVQ